MNFLKDDFELCKFKMIDMLEISNGIIQNPYKYFKSTAKMMSDYLLVKIYEAEKTLAGSLPVKQLRMVQAWAAIHEDELYEAWNKAVRSIPFDKIDPLR